jgi:hypothetical protein
VAVGIHDRMPNPLTYFGARQLMLSRHVLASFPPCEQGLDRLTRCSQTAHQAAMRRQYRATGLMHHINISRDVIVGSLTPPSRRWNISGHSAGVHTPEGTAETSGSAAVKPAPTRTTTEGETDT